MEERTRELYISLQNSELLSKQKSEFVANISHELRTPMHSILSFTEIALSKLQKGSSQDTQRYLNIIHNSGLRLLHLLEDLLNLSKGELGKLEFKLKDKDLSEIIQKALDEISSLLSEKELKVKYNNIPGPIMVMIDEDKMLQVLFNILVNAIKYSPQKSVIEIQSETRNIDQNGKTEEYVVIHFKDHGPGIPDDELDSVFDKFVQSSRTKSGAGGSGLGLAISKQIVEGHQGKIWASNLKNEGACISIALKLSNL